jgi:hypothetical protein
VPSWHCQSIRTSLTLVSELLCLRLSVFVHSLKLSHAFGIVFLMLPPSGVFDGHNGVAAAEFMAREMSSRLDQLDDPTEVHSLCAAIEKADEEFMADANLRVHGSTACMALIKHGEGGQRTLTVANVREHSERNSKECVSFQSVMLRPSAPFHHNIVPFVSLLGR